MANINGMVFPVVGSTANPTGAQGIVNDQQLIDNHDHTTGKGVPITQAAISITGDLAFNSNSITAIHAVLVNNLGSVDLTKISSFQAAAGLPYYVDNAGVSHLLAAAISAAVTTTVNGLQLASEYKRLLNVSDQYKLSVRAATIAALPACTATGSLVGKILTANGNGALTAQDGVTLVIGNRLAVLFQATGADNGIYILTQVGDGSHPFILTRATDFDESAEVTCGVSFWVEEGTLLGSCRLALKTINAITVDTTALVFTSTTSDNVGTFPLTDGANITIPDIEIFHKFSIALGGSHTMLAPPTGGKNGRRISFHVIQDASHTLTFTTGANGFRFANAASPGGVTVSQFNTLLAAAGASGVVDIGFELNTTDSRWDAVALGGYFP